MSAPTAVDLRDYIRDIPDFPKPGIRFKDITPLLASPAALRTTIEALATACESLQIDVVAAAEARGFLFATPLALALNVGFIPIRKPGKLPYHRVTRQYALEYGTDTLEMHSDAVTPGARVLVLDDVLATGGTMRACCDLIAQAGAQVVACAFVLELDFLQGRERLAPHPVISLLHY